MVRRAWLTGMLCAVAALPGLLRAQNARVAPAPAFGAAELRALAGRNWVTNGGNLFNQRYSSLAQINRDNVQNVKAVWRVSLNGSGTGPGYSAQAQTLAFEGVLYVVTGDNDVFAVDVETGRFLWTFESDLDFDKTSVCCGRLSRGLGMGDGRIYLGRLDGKLIALDQHTGALLWETQAGDPRMGYGITAAPLYYDGMVITGFTGGEFGIRGRISAYDARTGTEIWNFYTIPGPGEIGHATWPQDNDAWKFGGAPVWQTPSVDPDLGMLFFSTGNAGPDVNGAFRPGDNLFTASVLALDARTGAYRWHFQQVRHDIWDYDAPNPTILFDAVVDGVPRKGIAQVSKSGYLYILDRTSGLPLTPVVYQAVPQDAVQATASTQPVPLGDLVIRHDIDVVGEGFDGTIVNEGRTFTPFSGETPGIWRPISGVSWQPSSYNVDTHWMYICASDGVGGGSGGDPAGRIGPEEPGGRYVGGNFGGGRDVGADTRRVLVAMDLRTHRVAWRRLLDDRCAGTVTTAGGLIFAGRYNGELTALDSDTGRRLWTFQTDGGFTTTVTSFEHKGVQYLAGVAGGGVTGGRLNDGLWLFSLNGTIESLPPGAGEPDAATDGQASLAEQLEAVRATLAGGRPADLDRGAGIYRTICIACHGETGEGGHEQGAPFGDELTIAQAVVTARNGVAGTAMASFGNRYSFEELQDVATYIVEGVISAR